MKLKIQIKNRFTGSVMFEFESENNSMKKTLEAAIKNGSDLSNSNLRNSDLRNSNLRNSNLSNSDLSNSDLSSSDLSNSNLSGCLVFDENLKRTPLFINGLFWPVTITDSYLKIGCQLHKIDDWSSFTDDKINSMDSKALEFWHLWSGVILRACKTHNEDLNKCKP